MSTDKAQSAPPKAESPPTPPAAPPPAPGAAAAPAPPHPAKSSSRRWLAAAALLVVAIVAAWWIARSWGIVSTDDAYIDGHVTFVAPRVSGQVAHVLVDDNHRVRKGDLLVQLDPEPFDVQVQIAQAAVTAAVSDLDAAQAQARGIEGQTRSLRYNLEHAIENVDNQVALLHSRIAALQSEKASLAKAQADYDRAAPLLATGSVSKDEFDQRQAALLVAKARVEEALQGIYQVRVSLGLDAIPPNNADLAQVPPDLDQTFSTVRAAQASLLQAAAALGITDSVNKTPRQMIADFYKRDPQGNIDRIYAALINDAPLVKQAQAKLAQANRHLDEARLNRGYCDVISEIDGVVTRRNVNPGNNVVAGQALMAVRSLTEIWVDANFKETQLAKLRIGQPVNLDVDMYGRHASFRGRISGFTMGTGSSLALLPAENATGNFVKVVQRLPVRIELVNYDPDKLPLFIGLSVTPRVHINDTPEGLFAGRVLQPYDPMSNPAQASENHP